MTVRSIFHSLSLLKKAHTTGLLTEPEYTDLRQTAITSLYLHFKGGVRTATYPYALRAKESQ